MFYRKKLSSTASHTKYSKCVEVLEQAAKFSYISRLILQCLQPHYNDVFSMTNSLFNASVRWKEKKKKKLLRSKLHFLKCSREKVLQH